MPAVSELIRSEADGTISFGNHELSAKAKKEDFEHDGDLYKVKTWSGITKLERNGMFVYESVPGTTVSNFSVKDTTVTFSVEGDRDVQITVQLEDDTEYGVYMDGEPAGEIRTNMGGKLNFSLELSAKNHAEIEIRKK